MLFQNFVETKNEKIMKTKQIVFLCLLLMGVSFSLAQSRDEIEMMKEVTQQGDFGHNPVLNSLTEEPRAFLHQPWLSVSMPESKEAVVSIQNQENGRIVYRQTYFYTQGMMIDLSGVQAGTYQLRIEMDGTVYTGTFRL